MKKILLILILLLIIGTATAVNIDDLNIQSYYIKDNTDGFYELNTDKDVHLYIGNYTDNKELFESNINEGYLITDIGNNTYFFIDETMNQAGLQEVIEIDGNKLIISITRDGVTDLSNVDKTLFQDDLTDFNNNNNVQPVEVEIS